MEGRGSRWASEGAGRQWKVSGTAKRGGGGYRKRGKGDGMTNDDQQRPGLGLRPL